MDIASGQFLDTLKNSSHHLTSPNLKHSFLGPTALSKLFDIAVKDGNVYITNTKPEQKTFSLPSFTAPDTEVIQSFSGLDPRLQQCLGISQEQRNEYVHFLDWTLTNMLAYFGVAGTTPEK